MIDMNESYQRYMPPVKGLTWQCTMHSVIYSGNTLLFMKQTVLHHCFRLAILGGLVSYVLGDSKRLGEGLIWDWPLRDTF